MMKLAQKKIVVVGLGITGTAVACFLKKRRASVIVSDLAAEVDREPQVQKMREMDIPLDLGRHSPEIFESAEIIVLSPGVSHTIEPVARARKRGIEVMGEIELASRFIREPIVAVTGTNGKTTTTELLGEMLKTSGYDVFVGGNIGDPLIGYVDRDQKADVIVAEISSFQLDTISKFRPQIGVLLNITADHLDRYPDFNAYAASKIRLFENQNRNDIAILNGSDPQVRSLAERLNSKKLYYAVLNDNEQGALINGKKMNFRFNEPIGPGRGFLDPHALRPADRQDEGGSEFQFRNSLDISDMKLIGRHNLENACAAGLAALAAGARPQAVQKALNGFRGGAHRLEWIDQVQDVDYYNDSKATNVDAVIRALMCFTRPVVLIMGGLDKGGDFQALRDPVSRHVKKLVVMGSAADKIKAALEDIVPTLAAASMTDAVEQARRAASSGDLVLLSPGCASFDMYDNYVRRGEEFRRAVGNLK
jgi:UDP-N-acetylmuramoylalanine--D-glutamate ligase